MPPFADFYMVAFANYAPEEFALAAIESPSYNGATAHCFKFYYNFQVGSNENFPIVLQ